MTRSRKRKLKRARALITGVPLASTILAYMPLAIAQQQVATGALEEVMVTAQKRSENLQDVPVSITALGMEQLEQYNIDSFTDYVKFLPSVSYQSFGPGFAQVYMRGVASGENGNHSGPLPSVGIYLDEQPITTIQGALDLHIYDIARVEALAGPQGTLYGASSQAGTLRIITNKPDPSGFSAAYDLQGNVIDGGSPGGVAEGYANIPISEHAAIRLVGWYQHDGGYIDNVLGTRTYPTAGISINNANRTENNYNDADTYGGRAALKIDLNDNWTVTPAVMGQIQKTNGNFAYDPAVGDNKLTHFYPESTDDRWVQAALTVEGKISNFDVVYAGSYLTRDVDERLDYTDYSYFYDVLYGYTLYDNTSALINPSQYIVGKDRYTKQSHELRISSPKENRLRAVVGLFMQRQEHGIEQRYKVDNLADAIEVPGWSDTIWLTEQKRVDRDYAAFGEVSFDLLDNLTATGGVRYYVSDNSLRGFFGYSAAWSPLPVPDLGTGGTGEARCFSPESVNGAPCLNLDKEVKETGFTPKANLTYKYNDDLLFYFTYSKGFRPGGINRRGTLPPYKSDFLTSYELGWKTSWAGDTLRFNGALFLSNWDDIQFSYLGQNGLTEIKNANTAEIKGIETSLDWLATDHLTISGGFSLLNAELTQNYCGTTLPNGDPVTNCPAPLAPKGTSLPVTPDFKSNLTGRYTFDLAGFDSFLQGSLVYQTSSWADLRLSDRAAHGKQDGYALFDVSAGMAKNNYWFEIFLDNAFDERAQTYKYDECTVCGAQTYIVPNQPRTVGIKFGQRF